MVVSYIAIPLSGIDGILAQQTVTERVLLQTWFSKRLHNETHYFLRDMDWHYLVEVFYCDLSSLIIETLNYVPSSQVSQEMLTTSDIVKINTQMTTRKPMRLTEWSRTFLHHFTLSC